MMGRFSQPRRVATGHVAAQRSGDAAVIRPLRVADLPQVHRIETAVSPDPWSRELFTAELGGEVSDRHWLVVELDGKVVAFGGLLLVLDEAHIMNLAVDPGQHRKRLATRLVARLLADASDRGAIGVTLEVRASNQPAVGLYQRFGFAEAGRRRRYYPNGEDAIIMWVHRIHRPEFAKLLARHGQDVPEQGSQPC